ncbi:MAG: hypothetical protein ACO1RX_11145 [Candidatus Sericytochromatia bacterium]
MKRIVTGAIGWALVLVALAPVQAAGQALEVFADKVEVDLKGQSTRFSRNVRILFEPYQARCEQAQVILDPTTRRVTRILMQGGVTVQRGSSVLKGQRITLDVKSNRLTIEGQVYTRMQFDQPVNLNLN